MVDKYVMVGNNGYIVYSTDGINWATKIFSSNSELWESVAYSNGKYIAVGYNGYIASSANAVN